MTNKAMQINLFQFEPILKYEPSKRSCLQRIVIFRKLRVQAEMTVFFSLDHPEKLTKNYERNRKIRVNFSLVFTWKEPAAKNRKLVHFSNTQLTIFVALVVL